MEDWSGLWLRETEHDVGVRLSGRDYWCDAGLTKKNVVDIMFEWWGWRKWGKKIENGNSEQKFLSFVFEKKEKVERIQEEEGRNFSSSLFLNFLFVEILENRGSVSHQPRAAWEIWWVSLCSPFPSILNMYM